MLQVHVDWPFQGDGFQAEPAEIIHGTTYPLNSRFGEEKAEQAEQAEECPREAQWKIQRQFRLSVQH